MPYGLYLAAEGAIAQSARLDTIANNLANVDTPGFKRDVAIFQARFTEEIERGLDQPGSGSINDLSGGVMLQGTLTDFSAGPIKSTNIRTDLAIEGDGFFLIQKGDQNYLTRAGNFRLTNDGRLVTQDGYAVLDVGGAPVQFDPTVAPWSFTADGSLQQGEELIPLALVRPKSPLDLVKVGETLFFPLSEPVALEAGERQVLAEHLELSGVRPTAAMMELIEASRAFESNVSMIRNQDEMLGTLINRILRS